MPRSGQPTISTFYQPQDFKEALLTWLVAKCMPLSHVEDENFRSMLRALKPNVVAPSLQRPLDKHAMHTVHTDICQVEPEIATRESNFVIVVDRCTRYIWATPCPHSPTAGEIIEILRKNVWQMTGYPRVINGQGAEVKTDVSARY